MVLAGHLGCGKRTRKRRVELYRVERIVVLAELFLERLGGGNHLIPSGGKLDAGLIEGRLVEEEHTACGRNRNAVQLAVDRAGREIAFRPLLQVDESAYWRRSAKPSPFLEKTAATAS